jgi:acetolactate synthase regulatory subunit
MSDTTVTVLVVVSDGPCALSRLLARCHSRGWTPVSLRSVSDGARCDVAMRLRVPDDRRGSAAQVRAQLARLVDVQHVAVDAASAVPDDVAFAAVRHAAPWIGVPAGA